MSLTEPVLTSVLSDPLCAARASGRPIVAFASNNVPVELIHATGCFPVQLPTSPRPTPRADRYLEARFDPFVRSALEAVLAGELADAIAIVLPRTTDSWQRLYYYLCELERSFGERMPKPILYDLLHTPWASSADYNLESTRLLARALEERSGNALTEAGLSASIARYDGVRARLGALAERRRARPCLLRGEDALELYTASQRLAPEDFEPALGRVLDAPAAPALGTRALLIGSAHDTPALYRQIERAGGQVIADRHWRGDALYGPPIGADAPPLAALSAHYHRHTESARTYPPPLDALARLATAARAEAAIFFYYSEEEALTWEHAAQRDALRALGLRTLTLDRQAYPPSAELEPRLSEFFATPKE